MGEEPLSSIVQRIRTKSQESSTETESCEFCGGALYDGKCRNGPCRWVHDKNFVMALEYAGVPARYQRAHLEDFSKDIRERGLSACKNNMDVFLSGPTGIGKTYLAAALVVEYLPRLILPQNQHFSTGYFSMVWTSSPQLLLDIRATYGKSKRSEQEVVSAHTSPRLLVLDDFGAEKVSDWSVSTLYLILSHRIDAMRPTIVTTNLTLDQIDRWEPRIASRLASFVQIDLGTKDRRVSPGEADGRP